MNLAARIAPPQIHLALFIGRDLTQPEMKIRTTLSRVSAASIHLRDEFGPEPDLGEVYDHIMRTMQETLDALAAERRLPVIG